MKLLLPKIKQMYNFLTKVEKLRVQGQRFSTFAKF